MHLYLLRHGEAEPSIRDDQGRELTPRGREDVARVARQFAARGIRPDRCFSSPYIRARQTAGHFLAEAGLDTPLEMSDVLTPDVRIPQVLRFLGEVEGEHILLVSHNPLLSELAGLLLDGEPSRLRILGTSELVCIVLDVPGPGMGTSPFRLVPQVPPPHG